MVQELNYLPFISTTFLSLSYRHYWCYQKVDQIYLINIFYPGLLLLQKRRLFLLRTHTRVPISLSLFITHSQGSNYLHPDWKLNFFSSFFIKLIVLCTNIYCLINSVFSNLQLPLELVTSMESTLGEKVHIPFHRI